MVIPAFNEQERITATVLGAKAIEGVTRVVVVDDGSRDNTSSKARDAGAHVVRQKNFGKAAAMARGADEVAVFEGDGRRAPARYSSSMPTSSRARLVPGSCCRPSGTKKPT